MLKWFAVSFCLHLTSFCAFSSGVSCWFMQDAGLRHLLDLLRSCDVHVSTSDPFRPFRWFQNVSDSSWRFFEVRSLNLDANRLTEASLVTISDLIAESRMAVSAVPQLEWEKEKQGEVAPDRVLQLLLQVPCSVSNHQSTSPQVHMKNNRVQEPGMRFDQHKSSTFL